MCTDACSNRKLSKSKQTLILSCWSKQPLLWELSKWLTQVLQKDEVKRTLFFFFPYWGHVVAFLSLICLTFWMTLTEKSNEHQMWIITWFTCKMYTCSFTLPTFFTHIQYSWLFRCCAFLFSCAIFIFMCHFCFHIINLFSYVVHVVMFSTCIFSHDRYISLIKSSQVGF